MEDYTITYEFKISQFIKGKENVLYKQIFLEEPTKKRKQDLLDKYLADIQVCTNIQKIILKIGDKLLIINGESGPIKIYWEEDIDI